MRVLVAAAIAAAFVDVTTAQELTIDDACARAAEIVFQVSEVEISEVQSFPEFSPPRVQMLVSSNEDNRDAAAKIVGSMLGMKAGRRDFGAVRCEFERARPPFQITAFECAGMACYLNAERIEELRTMLAREGF